MRPLLAAAAVALTLAAPVPARAGGWDYRGGCGYATTNNPTGSGALGGRGVWTGEVDLAAVLTDDSADRVPASGPITVSCELWINGVLQRTVLGPVSGSGVVAAAGPLQFRAGYYDVVNVCDHVVLPDRTETICYVATATQLVPQPIIDLVEFFLEGAEPVIGPAREPALALYATAVGRGDEAACTALRALAPAVDAADRPDLLSIDPTGDTHSGPYWVYDCPPYTP